MAENPSVAAYLRKHSRLALDTSVFIYFVQEHPRYHSLCVPLFDAIEKGRLTASTSTLSLLEVLVQPYRIKREDLVLRFYALLTTYPHLQWIDLSKDIADTAARMRAAHRAQLAPRHVVLRRRIDRVSLPTNSGIFSWEE